MDISPIVNHCLSTWKNNEPLPRLSVQEIGQLMLFFRYINNHVCAKNANDAIAWESQYDIMLEKAIKQINSEHPNFLLQISSSPRIYVSLHSLYWHAQLSLKLKNYPKSINEISIPLKFDYSQWSTLNEDQIKQHILIQIPNCIISTLSHDPFADFIDPLNFNNFRVYELDIMDYHYQKQGVVLEITSNLSQDHIDLYYGWNALENKYVRLKEDSLLATHHKEIMKVLRSLQK